MSGRIKDHSWASGLAPAREGSSPGVFAVAAVMANLHCHIDWVPNHLEDLALSKLNLT